MIPTSHKLPRVLIIRGERSFPMDTVEVEGDRLLTLDQPYVALRATGEFAGRAFYLAVGYEWVLGQDSEGCTVLVPLKVRT